MVAPSAVRFDALGAVSVRGPLLDLVEAGDADLIRELGVHGSP
jgi:hypothetical protein